jgi:hypothetical protein
MRELKCLEHGESCSGTVEYRYPLSSTGKNFARCDLHWAIAVKRWEENQRKYGGSCPPSDFDPTYAGERWDEDD